MPEQNFYTTVENDNAAPSNFADAVTDAVLNAISPALKPLLPNDWRDTIKAELLSHGLPRLKWQTRIEGSCGDLCAATIELGNQFVENATGATAGFDLGIAKLSIEIQIKAQVAAGNYLPCPCTCTSNPSHQAWEKKKKEIEEQIAIWEKTHREWEAAMRAYHAKLLKEGSAFDKDGKPFPTPVWPPSVPGIPPTVPAEPAAGAKKCREFLILWTADLKVSAGFVGSAGATWTMKLGDLVVTVCTICCEPPGTASKTVYSGG